jgi:hypothetical protein
MPVRTTLRLQKIYKPVNAEFCQLAFNAWKGCAHGCRYCYGPRQTHKTAEDFRVPQSKVGDVFMDLKKDLELLSGKETVLAKEGKIWIPVPRPVPGQSRSETTGVGQAAGNWISGKESSKRG